MAVPGCAFFFYYGSTFTLNQTLYEYCTSLLVRYSCNTCTVRITLYGTVTGGKACNPYEYEQYEYNTFPI